jgi:hypothetical protein
MLLTSAPRFGRVSDLLRPVDQRFRSREQPGCNRPALIPAPRAADSERSISASSPEDTDGH